MSKSHHHSAPNDLPASPPPDAAAAAGANANDPAPSAKAPADDALAVAQAEAAANRDLYLRAMADWDNFRRRTVREKDELRQYAASKVLEDLLPALDNLALTVAAAQAPGADLKKLATGVGLVSQQLMSALAGHGLKEINPAGQPFDPHQHEAISHAPSAEVKAESVSLVVRTGYSLNGRLLRPASVIVSSGPAHPAGHPTI